MIEVGGALTFVAKRPTEHDERHREIVSRLDAMSAAQNEMLSRLAAM